MALETNFMPPIGYQKKKEGKIYSLKPRFPNHGSRPKIGSRRTSVWVGGTKMGRMGRGPKFFDDFFFKEKFFDGVFLEKEIFLMAFSF